MWKPSGVGRFPNCLAVCEMGGEAAAGDVAAQRRAKVKAIKRCCQQQAAHGGLPLPAVMCLEEEAEEIMSKCTS